VPQLLKDIRFEFDIKDSSLRLTDEQLVRVINRSRNSLFRMLVDFDPSWFRMRTTLTTTPGSTRVTLPERLYAPVRLAYADTDGREKDIELVRDTRTLTSSDSWETRAPSYYMNGTELVLYPSPGATARTLSFVFLQNWPDLVLPPGEPSCWDAQPGWDEWVVLNACMMLSRRSRKAEDVAFFKNGRDDIGVTFMAAVGSEEHEGPVFAQRVLFGRGEDDCA
jgi:hypothetical protein